MTKWVLTLLLSYHLTIVPVFYPKFSGIHDGQLTVSQAPEWHNIFHTGEFEQPDGLMIIWKQKF